MAKTKVRTVRQIRRTLREHPENLSTVDCEVLENLALITPVKKKAVVTTLVAWAKALLVSTPANHAGAVTTR